MALAAGVAEYLAHPPVSLGWSAYLVVGLLVAAVLVAAPEDGSRPPAFRLGVVAGLVGFAPLIWWIATPAGPLGWALLVSVEAAFYGAFAWAVAWWIRSPWLVVAAPILWTGMETWRGETPLLPFGWGELAYAHADGSPLLPLARVVGARGLTFATALLSCVLLVGGWWLWRRGDAIAPGRRRAVAPYAVAGLLVVAAVAGATVAPPPATGATVDVLAVQGNDREHWDLPNAEVDRAVAEQMLSQTRAAVAAGGVPDLTVWPESSVDRDPFRPTGADLLPLVVEAAGLVEGDLLLNATLDGPRPAETFLNAITVLDEQGTPGDRYVKLRLVPFGEFIPWRGYIGRLGPLRAVARDGQAGTEHRTLRVGGVTLAPVICFETLFGAVVRRQVLAGDAEIVLASTNDASFGRGPMSPQHIAQSQLRAVETGRWVVHAALSGSSALIDPAGRLLERTGQFELATLRVDVPTVRGRTLFLTTGDVVGAVTRLVALGFLVGALLWRWRQRRRERGAT